jgi:putative selenium metabolism protein SsnA
VDLILGGGTVVTSLAPPRLAVGDVVVREGRVLSVGTGSVGTGSVGTGTSKDAPGAGRLDCSGRVVVPGNVCAHHHLYSTLARGMPFVLEAPRSFLEVLRRVWWRLDRALDDESVWLSAWAGTAEALLAGTTTVVDHHASPGAVAGSLDRVAEALEGLGARGVLCYEVSDRDGPDVADAGIEENRRFLARVPRGGGHGRLRGMVGAHASFTLSDRTLARCVDLATEAGVGVHVHAAEDHVDQADAMARDGRRVLGRLGDAGMLCEGSLLAHCVDLDDAELAALAASGATAVHNPRSNMNNGVGHARVDRFERLALGTDGVGGDLFEEGRAAYWRAREDDPAVAPQWVLDRLAHSAAFAGRAFGEPLLGRIEPGAPADLVVLDYDPPTPLTPESLGGHWVFGIGAGHVRDVVVDGRVVVSDRRLVAAGSDGVRERSREAAERLWRRMEPMGEHPFVPAGTG